MKFKVLTEMALPRKTVIDKVRSKNEQIGEHLIKCVVYKNKTNDLNDWKGEIATFLWNTGYYEAKGGPKLKPTEYARFVYDEFAETIADCGARIAEFMSKNIVTGKYPEFDFEEGMPVLLYFVMQDLKERTVVAFSDKRRHSRREYMEIVNEVFNKNGVV